MNPILQEMSDERQRRYDDAKKDLLQAIYSASKLDEAQKQQLAMELLGVETMTAFYRMLRQYYG